MRSSMRLLVIASLLSTISLFANDFNCSIQKGEITPNDENLLKTMLHPIKLQNSTPHLEQTLCGEREIERKIVWDQSLEEGILSYEITRNPYSESLATYGFDMGIAHRGEGCYLQAGDISLQIEKSCGTVGCSLSIYQNKKELNCNGKSRNGINMPIEHIGGFYKIIGYDADTNQAYEGLATLMHTKEKMHLHTYLYGTKETFLAKEQRGADGFSQIEFSSHDGEQMLCQSNSDSDNMPRITCKTKNKNSQKVGFAALFPKEREIEVDGEIDFDNDGLSDELLIQYVATSSDLYLQIWVAIQKKSEEFRFALDNSMLQDAFCGHTIEATVDSIESPLNKKEHIAAITLSDGMCDNFYIFWSKEKGSFFYHRD